MNWIVAVSSWGVGVVVVVEVVVVVAMIAGGGFGLWVVLVVAWDIKGWLGRRGYDSVFNWVIWLVWSRLNRGDGIRASLELMGIA